MDHESTAEVVLSRPKARSLQIIGALVLFFLVLVVLVWCVRNLRFAVVPGQPLVPVRKEVTGIEWPLTVDGDVDYLEALNQRLSQSVTPENNAVVKLLEVTGPVWENAALNELGYSRLGIPLPDADTTFLQNLFDWFKSSGREISGGEATWGDYDERWLHEIEYAESQPWTDAELPEIAAWLELNRKWIPILREGLSRSHYYFPLISQQKYARVIDAPSVLHRQVIIELLKIDTMRYLAEGEIDQCVENITAIYRLSTLVASQCFITSHHISIQLRNDANLLVCRVVSSNELSQSQRLSLLLLVQSQPEFLPLASRLREEEKYLALDCLLAMGRFNASPESLWRNAEIPHVPIESQTRIESLDWKVAMQDVARWYDKLARLTSSEGYVDRASDEIDVRDTWNAIESGQHRSSLFHSIWNQRQSRGEQMALLIIGLMTPELFQLRASEERSRAYQAMTEIQIAISIFRQENSRLPESLSELTPAILPAIPLDPISELPFQYQSDETGFRLYSVGFDRVDRQGQGQTDSGYSGDDVNIVPQILDWNAFLQQQQKE